MREKISDYSALIKLRLSLLVVFSAAMGFFYGSTGPIDFFKLGILIFAGFLITGSSNGLNQIFEKDLDRLMDRTSDRPLASDRMKEKEGILFSVIIGLIGLTLLIVFINTKAFFLGTFALASYAFAYTPLKQKTPFAVFVGAFPGAVPPMLGYVGATDMIDLRALTLFLIQFIWQFPHFWAIAWILDEDYKKAGFKMLPTGERDHASAFQTVVYTFGLLPITIALYMFNLVNIYASLTILIAGLIFLTQAFNLLKLKTVEAARKLMFGSFLYLPVVQLSMVLGKIKL